MLRGEYQYSLSSTCALCMQQEATGQDRARSERWSACCCGRPAPAPASSAINTGNQIQIWYYSYCGQCIRYAPDSIRSTDIREWAYALEINPTGTVDVSLAPCWHGGGAWRRRRVSERATEVLLYGTRWGGGFPCQHCKAPWEARPPPKSLKKAAVKCA
ncbi:hypothetical protein K431DRAFT_37743 [Polychaeton citri CBS 116435]|uniref:Uncharacterized protein n=1 Tax=Polychaeton citri CBS 116435 TaxID=1314669 RepID=A0A9P4UK58_9PEZI|nr:hypothetical protein K431DRAFT_37743 [Polychaeton citri CBS 116435]